MERTNTKKLRKSNDFTILEVANYMGYSYTGYYQKEKNDNFNFNDLTKLRKLFKCTWAELLGE